MLYSDFEKGSQKQHFHKVLYRFGREGGGYKKSTLCTLLTLLTIILDDPLTSNPHSLLTLAETVVFLPFLKCFAACSSSLELLTEMWLM